MVCHQSFGASCGLSSEFCYEEGVVVIDEMEGGNGREEGVEGGGEGEWEG